LDWERGRAREREAHTRKKRSRPLSLFVVVVRRIFTPQASSDGPKLRARTSQRAPVHFLAIGFV
jgi:hypothetical protein